MFETPKENLQKSALTGALMFFINNGIACIAKSKVSGDAALIFEEKDSYSVLRLECLNPTNRIFKFFCVSPSMSIYEAKLMILNKNNENFKFLKNNFKFISSSVCSEEFIESSKTIISDMSNKKLFDARPSNIIYELLKQSNDTGIDELMGCFDDQNYTIKLK